MSVEIREATAADAEEAARICHAAFKEIAELRRFPLDFPSVEYARAVLDFWIGNPSVSGVVAESDGRMLGSNFLDERDAVGGVGPISVDPDAQGHGVGRRLMEAVIDRGRDSRGVRLLQDAHNTVSFSLYASLGFDVKEPIALLRGRPASRPSGAVEVRSLTEGDLEECGALHREAHGFERTNALRDALQGSLGAVRDGRIVAYASSLTAWPVAHGVAESEEDMRELILGAADGTSEPISFLIPTRQTQFLRWCFQEGLQTVKPMTLMSIGNYKQPSACWFPSVLY